MIAPGSSGALDYLTAEERRTLDRHLGILRRTSQPHLEYQYRPLDWIVEKLGIARNTLVWSLNPGYTRHKWDKTPDPIATVLEAIAEWQDVGIESATGTGKSFIGACLVLWFLACWEDSIVNTYAPKEDQLRLYIWKEITALWPKFQAMFPSAELSDLRIRMDPARKDKWSAHGISVQIRAGEDSATKAQGAHAEHMLLIVEEAPGVDPAVMTALRNTRTGRHNLQLVMGNPDSQQDTLHKFCTRKSVKHVIISAYDHPNVVTGKDVVPGAASRAGIERISEEFEPGTPMYESRVRGVSPGEATDALIKRAWVLAAAERYAKELNVALQKNLAFALGVDVADSPTGDKFAKAFGRGHVLISVDTKPAVNANKCGEEVFNQACDLGIEPWYIGIDPVGVGAGSVNEMVSRGMEPRRLGGSMKAVNGAERAPDGTSFEYVADANMFDNLRSQMGWQLREDLRKGQIAINPEVVKRVMGQLTIVWYKRELQHVKLAEKKDIIKKYGESPNDFDAIMYWNWVRPRTMVLSNKEAGDDQHPGIDHKRRRLLPKTAPVNSDGTVGTLHQDDERERFSTHVPRYRMPRWNANDDDPDIDMDGDF